MNTTTEMHNYITLPSKLNDMSLEELEQLTPNYEFMLKVISNVDMEALAIKHINIMQPSKIRGVGYDFHNKYWHCRRKIKGKMVSVKASIDRDIVEAAAIEFAKKNNLKVYR